MDQDAEKADGDLYFDRFLQKASQYADLDFVTKPVSTRSPPKTRAYYGAAHVIKQPEELLTVHASRSPGNPKAFCVIENITPEWVKAIGPAWELDLDFFIQFMRTAGEDDNWASVLEREERDTTSGDAADATSMHNSPTPPCHWTIRGLFQSPGDSFQPSWVNRTWSSDGIRTCLSYHAAEDLDLLLVDKSPSGEYPFTTVATSHPRGQPHIHLPLSFEGTACPLAQNLVYFFSNRSRQIDFGLIHEYAGGHRKDWFLRRLSDVVWHRRFLAVKEDIYDVCVHIQEPDVSMVDMLHGLRSELLWIRYKVALDSTTSACHGENHGKAEDWAAYSRASQAIQDESFARPLYMTDRAAYQKAFMADVQEQENSLAQTFQILLASVSIEESQNSVQQSRRGVLLTWLAFIYAPLTFVTGIFGMNVTEINGSKYQLKVFGVALVLILFCTVGLYLCYKGWEAWRHRSPYRSYRSTFKSPWKGRFLDRKLSRTRRYSSDEKDAAKLV